MGVDYGQKRIGIALTDPSRVMAMPHGVIDASKKDKGINELQGIIKDRDVSLVVVGLPLDRSGDIGPMAQEVLDWIERLRTAIDIEVATIDERLTSAIATQTLREMGVNAKKQKGKLDPIAATLILDGYLSQNR